MPSLWFTEAASDRSVVDGHPRAEYLPHPVLCDGDGAIIKLREWYGQFHESPDAVRSQSPSGATFR